MQQVDRVIGKQADSKPVLAEGGLSGTLLTYFPISLLTWAEAEGWPFEPY